MKKISNPLVSIIIVNWNGFRWLPDCFGSLADQNYRNYEIIFVDNASSDNSVSWVENHYPKTKILVNQENLGFAGANNIGYRQTTGEYVLFLNNDTRVTKTFISELVSVLGEKDIAGAQSKILLMDKPDTHDSVGAFLTLTGFLYHYGFGRKNVAMYNKEIDLYTAKGACMMFKKRVLDKVSIDGNIFDPDYFAYFEESDMCHRVWLAGYRIVYAYKSVIYHKMGATSSSMNNAFIQYHSFKNRIRTYIKNLDVFHLSVILPIHTSLCVMLALFLIVKGKFPVGFAVLKAIVWNMFQIVPTIVLRYRVQTGIRKIRDSEFMSGIFRHPSLRYYIGMLSGRVGD